MAESGKLLVKVRREYQVSTLCFENNIQKRGTIKNMSLHKVTFSCMWVFIPPKVFSPLIFFSRRGVVFECSHARGSACVHVYAGVTVVEGLEWQRMLHDYWRLNCYVGSLNMQQNKNLTRTVMFKQMPNNIGSYKLSTPQPNAKKI